MAGRMAGFSVDKALKNQKSLVNREDYIDENGKVDMKKLMEELNKISKKMTKECNLIEHIPMQKWR